MNNHSKQQIELFLLEYAAGNLDPARSLIAASYVTMCPYARQYFVQCEALGGTLIEYECEPVPMSSNCINSLLEKIDTQDQPCEEPCDKNSFCDEVNLPDPLAEHISIHVSAPRWRSFSKGIKYVSIPNDSGSFSAWLIKMAPNARSIYHTHPGTEITLVLEGSYHDEFGQYKRGDIVINDNTVEHQPIAEDKGCLCLVATDLPVRYSGALGTLLNFFIR